MPPTPRISHPRVKTHTLEMLKCTEMQLKRVGDEKK
jgi:hypothetical protein